MIRKTKGKPNATDIRIGQQLLKARCNAGLSQEKLADAVGLTFQQIQKYEKGINRIAASRLLTFAEVLGVPVTYFFDTKQKDTPVTSLHEGRALRAYRNLPSKGLQNSVIHIMEAVNEKGANNE